MCIDPIKIIIVILVAKRKLKNLFKSVQCF